MMNETHNDNGNGAANGQPAISGPISRPSLRRRRFVVVVDSSPESKVAIRFASLRAAHITGGALVLFHCIRPGEFQHWMAVAERMREEAKEEAQLLMEEVAERLNSVCGVVPEIVIKEGDPKAELQQFLEEQDDIFGLVLGISETPGTPGPLVDYFTHEHASMVGCPVILVPGGLSYEDIEDLA